MELLNHDDGKRISPDAKRTTQYVKTVEALREYHNANVEYEEYSQELKLKKARVLTDIDLKKDFPNISRPTVDDKKAFVTTQCGDEISMVAMLEAEKNFKRELFEIEKIMLQKEEI